MEIIRQTNRTILFEEINPEKLDLLTLIGDTKGIDSLDDEKLKEINEKLLIKNFDEFLKKFSPIVYSYFNAANQKVMYTLKKPEGISDDSITEVHLDENNDFLKMLFTLIDTKKSQGLKNADFKFQNVLDMISPKKVMEDIKQVRKEISYLYSQYEELEEEDPKKLDMGDKLNQKFEEASKNYNNVLGMLPLAIEDIKTRLLLGQSQDGANTEPLKIGVLTLEESGELKIIEAPKPEQTAVALIGESSNNSLAVIFKEDYEDLNETPNDYVGSLVMRTFAPIATIQGEIDVEKEVNNYNNYLEFYKQSKEEFVKAAKPLIEKILGIKMYFEQYATKNKGMIPSLLVTNCKPDMLVKSANKPRIETYFNTVNAKNDFNDMIWFGIVPAIELEDSNKNKQVRERFKGSANKQETPKEKNTMETLSMLLDIAKNYRIQMFFNFEATEETSFNNLATIGVDKYIEKTESLTRKDFSEFAIPCLPNFTIIPKDKSGVVLDSKMKQSENGAYLSKEKEDIMKLWLEGIYIDASYVAAGIVSAYQCPEYLKDHFKNVSSNYPGVRFDIEGGDNALKVTTTLAKEITGYTNTIKDLINKRNFGFVFSSDNASINGKPVTRITVYKSRNLEMKEDGFDSIFKTMVATYIERMLRFSTNDFKQDKIVNFFSTNPNSQKSIWTTEIGKINAVLQVGDDITHEIDPESSTCNLNLTFNGNVKNLLLNITKSTSAN
jgi:hypothetical protein